MDAATRNAVAAFHAAPLRVTVLIVLTIPTGLHHSAQGWRVGEPTLGQWPLISSPTPKELNPFRTRLDATPSG